MILLDRVTKTYPGDEEPVLDNISLHIDPHEFVFLVGKSGAGKSTLIKMITKEEQPDSGKIIVGGIDLDYIKRRHIPHYRRRLGVVFQDYKLLPTRTVFENVAFALEIAGMSGRDIQKTVPTVLELVGLENKANRFPARLSGGERQRVAIARSVARQPKILIADEPTGNLDVLTRKEIIELLQKINDFGTTLLVTTHDENIVNHLRKRVITLKDGRLINDQKVHGVYRLNEEDETPDPELSRPQPEHFQIITRPPIIQKIYSTNGNVRTSTAPRASRSVNVMPKVNSVRNNTNVAPKANSTRNNPPVKAATPAKKSAAPKKPTTPPKKLERDSANQWYAASKPLKAAPKLSRLSPSQIPKLKPAPSIKQVIKRPLNKSNSKQKRII